MLEATLVNHRSDADRAAATLAACEKHGYPRIVGDRLLAYVEAQARVTSMCRDEQRSERISAGLRHRAFRVACAEAGLDWEVVFTRIYQLY